MNDLKLRPARQSFTGVWRLESYTDGANPRLCEPQLGVKASGILIYTENGWVSAQLTIPTRQMPDAKVNDSAPSKELEAPGNSYLAYCGSYHLDLHRSEVIHVPEVASLPQLVNQPQRRRFVFVARDILELTAERVLMDSTVLSDLLTWRRCSPSFPENAVDD